MKFNFDIPEALAHLKIDERGYPIPFFVSRPNGKPDFRLLDATKYDLCITKKLCAICGKKVHPGSYYFISGPIGLQNKTCTDSAMHRVCAEFSLKVCPHMYFEKAEYRDGGAKDLVPENPFHLQTKPTELFLVKAKKFEPFKREGYSMIKFWPVSTERYIYENGKLIKDVQ